MIVSELLESIIKKIKTDPEILNYEVMLEQCSESDKEFKRTKQKWIIHDTTTIDEYNGMEHFSAAGLGVYVSKEHKMLFIDINY